MYFPQNIGGATQKKTQAPHMTPHLEISTILILPLYYPAIPPCHLSAILPYCYRLRSVIHLPSLNFALFQCLRFLKEKVALASKMHTNDPAAMKSSSFVSSREMWNFIKETGISKVSPIFLLKVGVFTAISQLRNGYSLPF